MAYEAWTVEWDMPTLVQDPFTRFAYSDWGSIGAFPYTTVGGAATDYSVDGVTGRMSLGSVNVARAARRVLGVADVEMNCIIYNHSGVVPTGAGWEYHARLRYFDDSNFVDARIFPNTTNTVTCSVRQVIAGLETNVGFPTVAGATTTSTLRLRLQAYGSTLRARIWVHGQAEPAAWTVEMTTQWLTAGDMELRAFLGSGTTNPLPVIIGWDDLQVTTPERWVDITRYVDTARGTFAIVDGDTAEASTDTGSMALPLLNADQRFTPGNTASPYHPNIRPGRRVRGRETIADQRFDRLTGYVQYPEIAAWTESNGTSPRDQTITIPVVDRVAWIAQGRKFLSTLAEHIIYHGGPSMVAYWPMGESDGPDVVPAVGAPWTIREDLRYNQFAGTIPVGAPAIGYGAQGIPPADDLSAISFTPTTTATPSADYVTSLMLAGKRPTAITLAANQVLTVAGWTRPGNLLAGAVVVSVIEVVKTNTAGQITAYVSVFINASGNLVGAANTPNWGGVITGPPAPKNHSMPVAVRVGFDPIVFELWVRGEIYTDTLTVTSATAQSFDTLQVGERYPGAVNHGQVYLGAATDWDHTDFVSQHEMGLYGLERQTTGERIRTVLQYAGIDSSDLGRIDRGVSLMQVAALAGRGPIDAVTDAVTTEQGEFYAAGSGLPVFDDRIRLYNI